MEVWLVPVAGTRVLVPFRFSVPTPLGLGVLEATQFVSTPLPSKASVEDAITASGWRLASYPRNPRYPAGRALTLSQLDSTPRVNVSSARNERAKRPESTRSCGVRSQWLYIWP